MTIASGQDSVKNNSLRLSSMRAPKPDEMLRMYAEEARKYKLLSKDEEQHLGRLIKSNRRGAATARRKLAQSNLRLVIHLAKKYDNRGLAMLDIVQEGNLGLMIAVKKFDVTKGFRFTTYATWWVEQAIRRAIMNTARLVRLPVNAVEMTSDAARAAERLRQTTGREPDITELAKSMRKNPRRLEDAIRGSLTLHPLSLDGSASHRDPGAPAMTLGSTVEAAETTPPALDPVEVKRILGTLDDKERHILVRRFGLDGREPETLSHVARRLGVSRERVRQLQARAIMFLRKSRRQLLEDPSRLSTSNVLSPAFRRRRRRAQLSHA